MKLLITIAVALIIGAGLIWVSAYEPGFVLLKYGNWTLETSLVVLVVAFLLLLFAGYFVLRSFMLTKQAPKKIMAWQKARRSDRASYALTRGLIALEEGRWAESERLLARHAGNSETPLLHYLASARAAQKQGESERRDTYLRLAHESTEGADVAVGVVQAELQIAAGQKEQAIATLQHLREVSPKHPYVLQLLQQLYLDMNEWQSIQEVLPDLRKRNALPAAEVKALTVDVAVGQMKVAVANEDWSLLDSIWQQSPTAIKRSEAVLAVYVQGLQLQHEDMEAHSLVETYLDKNWSNELVYYFGKVVGKDSLTQLAKAEKWLLQHPENPWLLLTLGRIAANNELWAKAEEYMRSSLKFQPMGETYQALAEVMTNNGKSDQVQQIYQQGLSLMVAQADNNHIDAI